MYFIPILTGIHTALSLIALVLGIPALLEIFGRVAGRRFSNAFLIAALATSLTGFAFPITALTPALITSAMATFVLALMLLARFAFHLAGPWHAVYAGGMVASQFFLVFVAIAQGFLKIATLNALAPNLSEPPFAIAQGAALLIFLVLGFFAVRRPGFVAA